MLFLKTFKNAMFIFLQKKKKKERKVVAQHWELLRFSLLDV